MSKTIDEIVKCNCGLNYWENDQIHYPDCAKMMIQPLADLLLGLPSLQFWDESQNDLAVLERNKDIGEIRQEIAEALGVK